MARFGFWHKSNGSAALTPAARRFADGFRARAVGGDIRIDHPTRALYSRAACLYEMQPQVVCMPTCAADVAAIVTLARECGLAITGRGAGSGLAGHAVGDGVVIDFSRYMTRITGIGDDWVRVQPGMVYAELNRELMRRQGRMYAPDPSSGDYCTLGGMIANNAAGARSFKYGAVREHITALEWVTADGAITASDAQSSQPLGRKVREIAWRHREALIAHRPRTTKNSSGYHLWSLLDADAHADLDINLTMTVVGSEGTLGLVTEATLPTVPVMSARVTSLCTFRDHEHAGGAIPALRELPSETRPCAIEILDAAFIALVREHRPEYMHCLPHDAGAVLLVEHEGDTLDAVRAAADRTRTTLLEAHGARPLALDVQVARSDLERERIWSLRKAASPLIYKMPGRQRPTRFIEDVVVPPDELGRFMSDVWALMKKHDITAPIFGHAGDGNIHVNPRLDLGLDSDRRLMEQLAEQVYARAVAAGGSLAGEHGDGMVRAPWVRKFLAPMVPAFEETKRAFDPHNIFNPGKILGTEPITSHLRFKRRDEHIRTHTFLDTERYTELVERCHGCGTCRTYCPSYGATHDEFSTPRARVNVLAGILHGALTTDAFGDDAVKNIMDHCFSCDRCIIECPTAVDVGELAVHFKEEFIARRSRTLADILLGEVNILGRLGGLVAPLANIPPKITAVRWVNKFFPGLATDLELPAFHARDLRDYFRRRLATKTSEDAGKRIVYFPGCYATFHDPKETGDSLLTVLEANGYRVDIPTFGCCGLPKYAHGNRAGARDAADEVLDALTANEYKDADIVTTCPSCSLSLTRHYDELVHDERAEDVKNRTYNIEDYLLQLNARGELNTDFQETRGHFTHHSPCHLTVQGKQDTVADLLNLIPGVTVTNLPDRCCGMGGSFGMKAKNQELSEKIRAPQAKAITDTDADAILSDCGPCRVGLGSATGKPTKHPLAVLAEAYRRSSDKS